MSNLTDFFSQTLTKQELISLSPYNYIPTEWICILFVVLYSITFAGHTGQAIYYRGWWLFPTMVTAAAGEIIGWSGRLWSSQNVVLSPPFYMEICCTIIAPSFMTAAMFIVFGRIINLIGTEYSRLKPRTYSRIFISADFTALVVQSAGGGLAASSNTTSGSRLGSNVMVAGIIIQMAAIAIYTLIAVEYLWRVHVERPFRPRPVVPPSDGSDGLTSEKISPSTSSLGLKRLSPKVKEMLIGLSLSTLFVLIRSVYRTIELLGGWNGKVYSNQTLFNTLDGAPIVLALFTLNLFHPCRLVPLGKEDRSKRAGPDADIA